MKDIINAVGTIAVLIVLVACMFESAFPVLQVLSGIGVVYIMYFHDEMLKSMWEKQKVDEYNKGVDQFNSDVDKYNEGIDP